MKTKPSASFTDFIWGRGAWWQAAIISVAIACVVLLIGFVFASVAPQVRNCYSVCFSDQSFNALMITPVVAPFLASIYSWIAWSLRRDDSTYLVAPLLHTVVFVLVVGLIGLLFISAAMTPSPYQ